MTSTDDYPGEMPLLRQVDEATAERILAGRAASAELESVATVMRALREVSSQPVRPSDTLREQMAAGVFTGGPVYSYRPATGGLVRRTARRVRIVVVAKIARMRLVTKLAAAGLAAAVLSASTAGFAGSLPEPVQDRFETVVESVTPYHFPEKTGGGRVGPTEDPQGVDPEDGGTDRPSESGGEVSEDANDGGVEGPEVSEDAREEDRGRPTDLPTPAQDAPGRQRRPTAPPGEGD